jgi:hypothetical protein
LIRSALRIARLSGAESLRPAYVTAQATWCTHPLDRLCRDVPSVACRRRDAEGFPSASDRTAVASSAVDANRRPRCSGSVSGPGSAPSAGQTATAVNDEPLPGDEAGFLRGEEAHGVSDVLGSPHAARRHGGEVGASDLGRHVGVTLDRGRSLAASARSRRPRSWVTTRASRGSLVNIVTSISRFGLRSPRCMRAISGEPYLLRTIALIELGCR